MWAEDACIYAAFNGHSCSTCKLSLKQLHGEMLRSRIVTGILSDAIIVNFTIKLIATKDIHRNSQVNVARKSTSVPEVLCSWPANHQICSRCRFRPAKLPKLWMYYAYQYAMHSTWMIEHKRQNRLPLPVCLP